MVNMNSSLKEMSLHELRDLVEAATKEIKKQEMADSKVEVTVVDLFGSLVAYKKPEDALESLVEYVKEDNFNLFRGLPGSDGEAPYAVLKMRAIRKSDYDAQKSDFWIL